MDRNEVSSLPVSALTERGLRAFEELLVRANGELSSADVELEAFKIASSPENSTVIAAETEIDTTRVFGTRSDVAEYIGITLEDAGIELGPSSGHEHVWSWLALVYLRQLCREQDGGLKVFRTERYILSREFSKYYRHLVAWPVWVRALHGEHARIFLCQPAFIMPDIVESVASRFDLITCTSVVRAIDRLYWDDEKKKPKAHAVDKPPAGQPELPGTVRALDIFLNHLGCTHDLRSMSESQILEKLPDEFSRFLDNDNSKMV